MVSIKFPNMLSVNKVNLLYDNNESTLNNLKVLLNCDRNILLGDPAFGSYAREYLFEQNDSMLRDIIIDGVYTTIRRYMPQLSLTRSNIDVTSDGYKVSANISCINNIDATVNNYNIDLITQGEE